MKKQLIVDGYNVMFAMEPYRELITSEQWDTARSALVDHVASYAKPDFAATVVFDGTRNSNPERDPTAVAGVTVLFSPYGQTADTLIERLVRRARERGQEVEIVTSDMLLQWTALGDGVIRRSAAEFADVLQHGYSEWERERDSPAARVYLEDRIAPEGRAALERIRRQDR
ncbi:MAG: NYN domain-containing protein [Coriobacteriia bacterium]|nr:NYN domain-containing protein [Coriobacteriia bacterium]